MEAPGLGPFGRRLRSLRRPRRKTTGSSWLATSETTWRSSKA